ncbi:type III pantothenate kinase [Exilibacterium tricleocarpae]|uniref:Type III pantothenate kinase n=1 Tax=Exilibacterium tricleocarpae TaxID=2591008 RepID=A0A545SQN1_9GAMM|nr:type III pantothenate kinase [Exilibacterium tricleocarpae]TQV67295.1 type III pantothenate kinase [Exilibacterium tricleocarpae]
MSDGVLLEIDMGNTRLKWRLIGQGRQLSGDSHLYRDAWVTRVAPGVEAPALIRLASVAGPERTELLLQHCRHRWQLEPEIAVTTRRCAGVTNAYRDPSAMGVDRWLAVLAAYQQWQRACLIVDCGSAVTLDMVDNEGLHLGGYIVPGLQLMRRALFRDTDAVKVEAAAAASLDPADNTADAVNRGLLLMTVGFVTEAYRRLVAELETPVTVVVTGGDGERVGALLSSIDARICPDLVLDGLALALP